jgi:hypothetical protein
MINLKPDSFLHWDRTLDFTTKRLFMKSMNNPAAELSRYAGFVKSGMSAHWLLLTIL